MYFHRQCLYTHLTCRWPTSAYLNLLHHLTSRVHPLPCVDPFMGSQNEADDPHRVPEEAKSTRRVHHTGGCGWNSSLVRALVMLATLQVLIMRSHGVYEVSTRWPQEIGRPALGLAFATSPSAYLNSVGKKNSTALSEQQSSQPKPPLEFPPFRQNILMQNSWDARDHHGRIKVLLSEQLIGNTNSPSKLAFGASNDIICFSFQHAPRGKRILHRFLPTAINGI